MTQDQERNCVFISNLIWIIIELTTCKYQGYRNCINALETKNLLTVSCNGYLFSTQLTVQEVNSTDHIIRTDIFYSKKLSLAFRTHSYWKTEIKSWLIINFRTVRLLSTSTECWHNFSWITCTALLQGSETDCISLFLIMKLPQLHFMIEFVKK